MGSEMPKPKRYVCRIPPPSPTQPMPAQTHHNYPRPEIIRPLHRNPTPAGNKSPEKGRTKSPLTGEQRKARHDARKARAQQRRQERMEAIPDTFPPSLGRTCFEGYRNAAEGKTAHGNYLPKWQALDDKTRALWEAGALAVVEEVRKGGE